MRRKNLLYKKTRAFTLTEILVVVTLIFIISGIVIVSVQDARKLARDKRRMSDFAGYQVALQEYYAKHKYYPYFELTGDENQKKITCESYGKDAEGKCTFDTDSSNCCEYNSSDDTCACLSSSILKSLQEEGLLEKLPLDPLNKTEDNTEYKYKYVFVDKGVDYKMFVPLEKDTQAMENDGGTDASWYEIFSTMGSSIAINYFKYFGTGGILSCNLCDVSGENKCGSSIQKCDTATKKIVIKIFSPSNAHAEEPSGSQYNCAVECSGPAGFKVVPKAGDQGCIGDTFLTLSANTNAHVGENYTNSSNRKICFDYSGASCRIVDTKSVLFWNRDCKRSEETCVLRIFNTDNAHITADCNESDYRYKVCCK